MKNHIIQEIRSNIMKNRE